MRQCRRFTALFYEVSEVLLETLFSRWTKENEEQCPRCERTTPVLNVGLMVFMILAT